MYNQYIRTLRDHIPRFYSGVIQSDITDFDNMSVLLDLATEQLVPVTSLIGPLAKGARVRCLSYPPRGFVVVGVETNFIKAMGEDSAGTRTTASTTFVDAGTLSALTFPFPASGILSVAVGGRINNTTAVSGDAAVLGFEIREEKTAAGVVPGAVIELATDAHGSVLRNTATPNSVSRTVNIFVPSSGRGFIRAMLRTNNAANSASMQQVTVAIW